MKKVLLLEDYLKIGEDSISEGYDQEFIEEALVVSEAEEIIDSIFEAKGDEEGKVKKFAKGVMSFFRGDLKKIRTLGNELKDSSVKKVTAKYEVEDKRRKLDDAVSNGKLDSEKAKQKKDDLATLQKDKEATLANKITDVKAEIDQIASDAGTGAADSAASAVKIAASLAANREILKYVEDREEKTAIVSKMKDQTSRIKDIQTGLKDDIEDAKAGKSPKPEAKPEAKPDAKPEAKPEAKPDAKPEVKVPPKKEPDEKKPESSDEKTMRVRQQLTSAQNDLRNTENAIEALEKKMKDISTGKVKFKSEEEKNAAKKDLSLKIDSKKVDIPDLKDILKDATDEWQKNEVEISKKDPKNNNPEVKVPPKKEPKPNSEPEPKRDRNFTYKDVSGKTKYVTAEDIDKAKEKVKKFNADIDLGTIKEA